MELQHTKNLLSSLFPLVVDIRAFTDDDQVFRSVSLYANGHSIDAEYLNTIIADKTPDQLYEATLSVPRVESKPLHDGYVIRLRALYFEELELLLSAIASIDG